MRCVLTQSVPFILAIVFPFVFPGDGASIRYRALLDRRVDHRWHPHLILTLFDCGGAGTGAIGFRKNQTITGTSTTGLTSTRLEETKGMFRRAGVAFEAPRLAANVSSPRITQQVHKITRVLVRQNS